MYEKVKALTKHSKHNDTLLHCIPKKFCEISFGNIALCSRFPADKMCQKKNSWDVEPTNLFCLHKLSGTKDFIFPAHVTLHGFRFLGRKDILWFGLQMAKWMIIPVGFINQAFGLVGNTFLGD